MRRVLVVEDSKYFANILKNNLGLLKYNVDLAITLKEAYNLLNKNKYDLIILDLNLPDGDGLEFCKSVKSDPNFTKTQIAVISASDDNELKTKLNEYGILGYFNKNESKEKLAEFILNLDRLLQTFDYSGKNILLIEDSKIQHLYLKGLLEYAGLNVYSCFSLEEAEKLLAKEKPKLDLVIMDYYLGSEKTEKFIQQFKSIKFYEHTPIMMITVSEDSNIKYSLFLLGVSDYLKKPFDIGEFYLRIRSHLRIKYLIDMLEAKNKMLSILATTDELTQLYNRRFFWELARKEENRYIRYGREYSIIILDIDNFKDVNDTYGHDVGDIVLKEIASKIKECVRYADILARFGGEEFILLLPETGIKGSSYVAEKIRKFISDDKLTDLNLKITVSLGVASRDETNNLEETIKLADNRLYKAKNNGKNRVEYL